MNRFFSKLNLQDIKINPEGNRFPPDADDQDGDTAPAFEAETADATTVEDDTAEAPATEPLSGSVNGHAGGIEIHEMIQVDASEAAQAGSNGHSHEPVATTVAYYGDGELLGVDGEVLKVSARSRPSAVAGAIAGVVREAGRAEVQAIGAGATNQAVKAVAIARDYLRETGIDAVCVPAFIDVTIDNEDRTAIRLVIEPR